RSRSHSQVEPAGEVTSRSTVSSVDFGSNAVKEAFVNSRQSSGSLRRSSKMLKNLSDRRQSQKPMENQSVFVSQSASYANESKHRDMMPSGTRSLTLKRSSSDAESRTNVLIKEDKPR
ncbi:hypothetical protein OTU49_011585, partial [Cherax quadricarinatus]